MQYGQHITKSPVLIRIFVYSSCALLLLTATAKLISAAGNAKILQTTDPILSLTFQRIFEVVGGLECIVALVCFFGRRLELKVALLAWLATSFLFYRFGLELVGWHRPCSCLGNLTDALHIPPQAADTTMKIILAYLLIGSYGILFHLWWKNRKLAVGGSELRAENPKIEAGS